MLRYLLKTKTNSFPVTLIPLLHLIKSAINEIVGIALKDLLTEGGRNRNAGYKVFSLLSFCIAVKPNSNQKQPTETSST